MNCYWYWYYKTGQWVDWKAKGGMDMYYFLALFFLIFLLECIVLL